MSSGAQWKPIVAMIAVNIAFALVNVLFKKILDAGTNHIVLITYRFVVSTSFLAPIAYYWERKSRPKLTARILCQLFIGALLAITLTQHLLVLGLKYTSATFSCAFLNTVPVNTFLLALPFGVEKLNLKSKAGRAKLLGALICMGGAILLILYKGVPIANSHPKFTSPADDAMITDKKGDRWAFGSMLLMAGCLTFSSWFLLQTSIGKNYPCPYSSTTILSFFGLIQTAVLSMILERKLSMWVLKGKLVIVVIIYAGVVGSGLCYAVLSWCVKQKGPVFTAAFTPTTQIFAGVFDFTLLHGEIYLGSVVGSVVVALGLYILLWGKSMEMEADECGTKDAQVAAAEDGSCDAESQVSSVTIVPKSPQS